MFTVLKLNAQTSEMQTETFKVWGNCGMCKKTIEKSLKVKGVSSAKWNRETKMITVVFDPKIIDLPAIHRKIASAGYDTELETADDKVYKKLHGCCQYERRNK
jgi:copper chaperone CopZ